MEMTQAQKVEAREEIRETLERLPLVVGTYVVPVTFEHSQGHESPLQTDIASIPAGRHTLELRKSRFPGKPYYLCVVAHGATVVKDTFQNRIGAHYGELVEHSKPGTPCVRSFQVQRWEVSSTNERHLRGEDVDGWYDLTTHGERMLEVLGFDVA